MEEFLSRHADAVTGTLSGFDRLVFRGTLRMLAHRSGMMGYLWAMQVLLKDFASHAQALTRQLREASEELARRSVRPIRYLASSATSKEDIARQIARADGIERGLICGLTAVEPCLSYEIERHRDSKRLELRPRHRKCLFLYHYHVHPMFGFMHARIQTWFPFSIQICLNGREWLARSLDAAGVGYVQRDNCFTQLDNPKRAQRLMERQVQAAWPELLNAIARSLNPQHATMFRARPIEYLLVGRRNRMGDRHPVPFLQALGGAVSSPDSARDDDVLQLRCAALSGRAASHEDGGPPQLSGRGGQRCEDPPGRGPD